MTRLASIVLLVWAVSTAAAAPAVRQAAPTQPTQTPVAVAKAPAPATPPAAQPAQPVAQPAQAAQPGTQIPTAAPTETPAPVSAPANAESAPPVLDAEDPGVPAGKNANDLIAEANEAAVPVNDKLVVPDDAIRVDLEARLKSIDDSTLSDEQKKEARELYRQALEAFATAGQQVKAAREFQRQLDSLAADAKNAAERLARTLMPFEDVLSETRAQVEARAGATEQWLKEYRQSLADEEAWLKRRTQRLPDLPKLIAEAQRQAAELSEPPADAADANETLVAARKMASDLRRRAAEATSVALTREQRTYQEAAEYHQMSRDHWSRKVAQKEKRLAQLKEEINRRREMEAQVAQAQARQAAATAAARPAAIAALAEANAQLAERRTKVAADITAADQQYKEAQKRFEALDVEFKRAKEQDALEELSDSTGQLLRQQRTKLPNIRELVRRKIERDAQRSDVQLKHYDLQDQRSALADVDETAQSIAASFGADNDAAKQEIRKLLEAKVHFLDDLKGDYEKLLDTLGNLSVAEASLISITDEYANFIAKRVLWIRSCAPPSSDDARPALGALAWSFDPQNWREVAASLGRAIERRPLSLTAFLACFVALVASQRTARRRLGECGQEAVRKNCTQLRPTIYALWLTIVLTADWPALLAFCGWFIDNPLGESEFVRALSAACLAAAVCLMLLELVRHLCREEGLADAHFDWPRAALDQIRRQTRHLAILGLPLVFWFAGLEAQTVEPMWSSSLGRLLFVAVMLLLAVVAARLLLWRNSPLGQFLTFHSRSLFAPLQAAWRPAIVLLPIVLAGLALAGYYYTAQQAALRITQTVGWLLAVFTVGGVTRRWLLVSRRRLAREQAKQRRAQLAAEGDQVAIAAADLVDDSVDIAALSEQTQKLVRTLLASITAIGLLLVWGELLPALAYLGEHPLVPGVTALTWGQVLKFVVVLAVTFVSVRDIPALLELLILQHLPLDGGVRYALSTLCRYLLAAIGIPLAFHMLNVGWDQIQWLVAAMSVGLGFGLQEIFGNFVSGVILLFERPIRVGDIVTLGETTGVVSRIRMRATTIVDWDRKEYIVPNKDLVTQRLLNWTLSDHTNRIVIKLGVVHGADTELACRLLQEAAREQPHVLSDPRPVAVFDGFGVGCLNLTLQCFLPSLEHRTETIHKLHTAIDRRFREAGIEIPAPSKETQVRIVRDATREFKGRIRKTG